MLEFLRSNTSDRKLRLFACACCRRIWQEVGSECREVVAIAERHADGLVSEADLHRAWEQGDASRFLPAPRRGSEWGDLAAKSTASRKWEKRSWWSRAATTAERARSAVVEDERPAQVSLLKDIVGLLPFRTVTIDTRLLPAQVIAIAHAAYAERSMPDGALDLSRLGVLSDALEEAGYANADLLAHLRSPGPHVRGCWAVDLLLAKE
jgi:hypothetical protein